MQTATTTHFKYSSKQTSGNIRHEFMAQTPGDGERGHSSAHYPKKHIPSGRHMGSFSAGQFYLGVCARTPCFRPGAQSLNTSPTHEAEYVRWVQYMYLYIYIYAQTNFCYASILAPGRACQHRAAPLPDECGPFPKWTKFLCP